MCQGRGALKRLRIALLLAAGVASVCIAQTDSPEQRVAWLREHAVRPRSIDPADRDYADLEAFATAIGDARVVLLGEASHGDGATMSAKGRIVQFLHQRKNFDVLAWEAGFYECTKAGQALAAEARAGESPPDDAAWKNVFAKALMWSHIDQIGPTMAYVHATQRTQKPIAVAGMAWYSYADSTLFDEVISCFNSVDPALPTRDQKFALTWGRTFLANLNKYTLPKKTVHPPQFAHLDALIELLERDPGGKFRNKHGRRQIGFLRLALENLKGHLSYFQRPATRGGADDNPIGAQEGRNVLFLAREYYPKRKLIVWAHSGHTMRGSSQIDELKARFKTAETIAAGQHIHEALGDAVYSVMFTAYAGTRRDWRNEERELPKPPPNSIEDLMHRAGLKLAFVDLSSLPPGHWLRSRLVARPIAHSPMRADWSQVCDGLFFIDKMTPTTTTQSKP